MIDPKKWQILNHSFSSELSDALIQQHHAAQFIALIGKHLVEQLPDDSNTNMLYSSEQKLLVGNKLSKEIHVGLQLDDLVLHILNEKYECKHSITLTGKTKNQVFDELKQNLEKIGIDITLFTQKLHYEIPNHDLDRGSSFNISDKDSFFINTVHRDNAEIILNNIAAEFAHASSVRIWPHHFDTGSYVPIEFNVKNEITKSFGIGWAIPDSMVNEPYYYLSFWSESSIEDFNKLTSPNAGDWIRTGWNGGVLKLSDIIKEKTSMSQYELVKSFYQSGIEIINKNYL